MEQAVRPRADHRRDHGQRPCLQRRPCANWQIFSAADGCAYVDFAGYHYRQHAASASHRALPPESIDQQRQAAVFIREHASPAIQQSANAFYYEKLVYLASMILRRDDAAAYRVQINELGVGIRAGLQD